MALQTEIQESLMMLNGLLRDVAEQMNGPSRADRRSAALKLERIAAIASTLAATIHSPRK